MFEERMLETRKATPVHPPAPQRPEVMEVDISALVATVVGLSVVSAGLTAVTTVLYRRVKRTEEYLEAIRDYMSRLINNTDCGMIAWQTLLDGIEEENNAKEAEKQPESEAKDEDADEEVPVDWADEDAPYAQQQETST